NMSLRASCSQCPFAKLPRQGDITLGDFWGIKKYSKKLDDKKGLSAVLINSPKGEKYIQDIQKQTKLYHKVPIKYAIKGNPCLISSSKPHQDRKGFFERLDKMSLKDNIEITLGNKYDCGILNFWFGNNYGAMLTCYGLQETLKNLGKNPKVINYIPIKCLDDFKNGKSDKFAQKYLQLTQLCKNKHELKLLNSQTDTFIVGSDQVWRHQYFWNIGANIFQLNFANSDKKKIAYAASFGTDHFEGNFNDTQLTKYYIQQFDHISVREEDAVDICKNTFDAKADHVLDPVFLADIKAWDTIINNAPIQNNEFIASYVLDKSKNSTDILNSVKKLFANIKNIDMRDGQRSEKSSVEDWIYAVKNCKFFITDSFHGACFAIIFNKPFICIINKDRGFSRFKSLFTTFCLKERFIEANTPDIENIIKKKIDWNKVNEIIKNEAEKSKKWLNDALNSSIENKNPNYEIMELIIDQQDLLRKRLELPKLKMRRLKYLIFSLLFFGKKRKKYKQKAKVVKQELKDLK
ncbi:MAG: polysaccharide pyruvyl transferase family protein, partial [Alphaproteobacteria bacterium]|nr:polysaccharide pyruvyl transferase family protein [Alphaproteobacteria bacterium]